MAAATRIGDKDVDHNGVTITRAEGSGNVYVNGIGWSREGDVNTFHLGHEKSITTGSTTVFVNGKGAGRVGDDVGGSECTSVEEGSNNVYAGD